MAGKLTSQRQAVHTRREEERPRGSMRDANQVEIFLYKGKRVKL